MFVIGKLHQLINKDIFALWKHQLEVELKFLKTLVPYTNYLISMNHHEQLPQVMMLKYYYYF
jgi:hypothetical protein